MSPSANFFYYPTNPSTREVVHFIDLTPEDTETQVVARSWDFGDGHIAHEAWPSHRFECDGDYDVELIVRTAAGGVATVTRTLRVYPD